MPTLSVQDIRLHLHALAAHLDDYPAERSWVEQNANSVARPAIWLRAWADSDGLLQKAHGNPQPPIIPDESMLLAAFHAISVDARAFGQALEQANRINLDVTQHKNAEPKAT